MPLNITNLINQIESRVTALDSSSSTSDMITAIRIAQDWNNYNFNNVDLQGDLPSVVDSSSIGSVFYVADKYADSYGSYYFGRPDGWDRLLLTADRDEDSDNFAHINSGNAVIPYTFQGSVSGYISGGRISPATSSVIEKFSFVTDGNATAVGNLTVDLMANAGHSSATSGYSAGGFSEPGSDLTSGINVIQKFPFAADGDATDVGDLLFLRTYGIGQSSETFGYTSGGNNSSTSTPKVTSIDKFPFSADGNATDVGTLTLGVLVGAGQSSDAYGYVSGGLRPAESNVVDKFPFSADANATDVGDLTQVRRNMSGQSSDVSGYTTGGFPNNSGIGDTIDKFPFASDANATDVGNLTVGTYGSVGQSSTASGYASGGSPNLTPYYSINKFPFASDTDATDIGDVTLIRLAGAGHQV